MSSSPETATSGGGAAASSIGGINNVKTRIFVSRKETESTTKVLTYFSDQMPTFWDLIQLIALKVGVLHEELERRGARLKLDGDHEVDSLDDILAGDKLVLELLPEEAEGGGGSPPAEAPPSNPQAPPVSLRAARANVAAPVVPSNPANDEAEETTTTTRNAPRRGRALQSSRQAAKASSKSSKPAASRSNKPLSKELAGLRDFNVHLLSPSPRQSGSLQSSTPTLSRRKLPTRKESQQQQAKFLNFKTVKPSTVAPSQGRKRKPADSLSTVRAVKRSANASKPMSAAPKKRPPVEAKPKTAPKKRSRAKPIELDEDMDEDEKEDEKKDVQGGKDKETYPLGGTFFHKSKKSDDGHGFEYPVRVMEPSKDMKLKPTQRFVMWIGYAEEEVVPISKLLPATDERWQYYVDVVVPTLEAENAQPDSDDEDDYLDSNNKHDDEPIEEDEIQKDAVFYHKFTDGVEYPVRIIRSCAKAPDKCVVLYHGYGKSQTTLPISELLRATGKRNQIWEKKVAFSRQQKVAVDRQKLKQETQQKQDAKEKREAQLKEKLLEKKQQERLKLEQERLKDEEEEKLYGPPTDLTLLDKVRGGRLAGSLAEQPQCGRLVYYTFADETPLDIAHLFQLPVEKILFDNRRNTMLKNSKILKSTSRLEESTSIVLPFEWNGSKVKMDLKKLGRTKPPSKGTTKKRAVKKYEPVTTIEKLTPPEEGGTLKVHPSCWVYSCLNDEQPDGIARKFKLPVEKLLYDNRRLPGMSGLKKLTRLQESTPIILPYTWEGQAITCKEHDRKRLASD